MRPTFCPITTALFLLVGCAAAAEEIDTHKVATPQSLKWAAAPPSLPGGAEIAMLFGDPEKPGIFALCMKMPKGYRIPPHMHEHSEFVTVLSGALSLGLGPAADRVTIERLPAGSFASMPHGVVHYVFVNEDSVIQINASGPWTIEYANAKDDPRLNGAPEVSDPNLYSSK